jgi:hypothetical protein
VASVLLLSAKAFFLIQYYVLMGFLVVKSLVKRILGSSGEQSGLFTHPKKEVHPDVFAHTCKFLSNVQTNSLSVSRSFWMSMNVLHRTMLMSRFGESDTLMHRKGTIQTQY